MIIISPAKNLNLDQESYPLNNFTKPIFESKTQSLVGILKDLRLSDIKKLMNLSDSLAKLNYERLKKYSTKNALSKPAAFLFSGDTFNGLEVRTLDLKSLNLAQSKLRILSGLYGLLRPFDKISPYRLEMGTSLKPKLSQKLTDFWMNEITDSINKDLLKNQSKFLFNLASNEYCESIDKTKLQSQIINFDFKKLENNKLLNIGMMIKKCRGSMAKFLIINDVKRLEQIKKFSNLGFRFHSFDESENKFIFTKNV